MGSRVAQKKGRKPSDEYLSWITFTFYVTNVESEIWTHKVVGTIYRLRWQIELIFKQWKSLLRIDCLLSTNENRIRCLVFGCTDPKAGACGSQFDILGTRRLNHTFLVVEGVCRAEASALLTDFLLRLRRR